MRRAKRSLGAQPRHVDRAGLADFAASMLRDIERGAPIEADHIVGDLLQRGKRRRSAIIRCLRIAYAHLKAYEARRSARDRGANGGIDVELSAPTFNYSAKRGRSMAKVTYHIVEHDGGWAYQVDGVFSETFPSHDAARAGGAARGAGAACAGRNPGDLVGR